MHRILMLTHAMRYAAISERENRYREECNHSAPAIKTAQTLVTTIRTHTDIIITATATITLGNATTLFIALFLRGRQIIDRQLSAAVEAFLLLIPILPLFLFSLLFLSSLSLTLLGQHGIFRKNLNLVF